MLNTPTRFMALVLFILVAVSTILADIPGPRYSPNKQSVRYSYSQITRLTVEESENAGEVRLVIPRSLLNQFLAENTGDASLAASLSGTTAPPAQTLIAGLFMSLAVVAGGFWLLRSRRKLAIRPIAPLIAVSALFAFAAVAAFGNAAPPNVFRFANPGNLGRLTASGLPLSGMVRVEIVPNGNEIKLIVPKAQPGARE